MKLEDLRVACEHGEFLPHDLHWWPSDPHPYEKCPGGRPVTLADLGGERVWWCGYHRSTVGFQLGNCEFHIEKCGWRLLVPIGSPEVGE